MNLSFDIIRKFYYDLLVPGNKKKGGVNMVALTSKSRISAIGTYVPEKVLSNFDLESLVETNNEWIVRRTGIKERRISHSEEFTSNLCVKAVEDLMNRYQKTIEDVDLILVATSTPDFPFPNVAS